MFSHFGGTSHITALGNDEQTDLHAFNNFSSLIDKVSLNTNSKSLGYVCLEKFIMGSWILMRTPQSDAIMLAQIKMWKKVNWVGHYGPHTKVTGLLF